MLWAALGETRVVLATIAFAARLLLAQAAAAARLDRNVLAHVLDNWVGVEHLHIVDASGIIAKRRGVAPNALCRGPRIVCVSCAFHWARVAEAAQMWLGSRSNAQDGLKRRRFIFAIRI